MKDDKLLIKECVTGSRRHQTLLYNRYYVTMKKVVTKYIDCPYVAEEVINDGFVRVFKKMHLFDFNGSFEGWMRKIMFRAVVEAAENDERIEGGKRNIKKGFFRNILTNNEGQEKDDLFIVAPDQSYDYHKILESIDNILPNASSTAFRMYLQGFKHTEIANTLNITEGTSKWHIFEAKKIIKEKLFNKN